MIELNLPIAQTFSMPLDVEKFKRILAGEQVEGHLGNFDFTQEVWLEIEMARKNGGTILYATTSIEQKMEAVLLNYFMGRFVKYGAKRELFEREILQSSALSYRAKKDLVVKVIEEGEFLRGGQKNAIQKHLKDIMEWRNAFAHGKLQYESKKGCILKYYSGSSKSLHLSDAYWAKVEACFKECDALIDEVDRKI